MANRDDITRMCQCQTVFTLFGHMSSAFILNADNCIQASGSALIHGESVTVFIFIPVFCWLGCRENVVPDSIWTGMGGFEQAWLGSRELHLYCAVDRKGVVRIIYYCFCRYAMDNGYAFHKSFSCALVKRWPIV